MLYQRRDDDVPIFLLRPIAEIRRELNAKVEEIKRGASPAPQSTSVLLDKSAHEQNLKVLEEKQRASKSRTPSPAVKSKSKSKSPSPAAADKTEVVPAEAAAALPAAAPVAVASAAAPVAVAATVAPTATPIEATVPTVVIDQPPSVETAAIKEVTPAATTEQAQPASASQTDAVPADAASTIAPAAAAPADAAPADAAAAAVSAEAAPAPVAPSAATADSLNELPTIVIEASATFVRTVSVEPVSEQVSGQTSEKVVTAENA